MPILLKNSRPRIGRYGEPILLVSFRLLQGFAQTFVAVATRCRASRTYRCRRSQRRFAPHAERGFELVDKTIEVAPGFTLIALVSDAPGTKELKELSLAINTPDGIVLVVGCSHSGIEAIVAEAVKINPNIRLIAGGLHLVVAPDPVIEKVASSLKNNWKVDWVAPGHSTGEPTFAALKQAFGDHYLYAGLGTVIELGATPRTLAARGATRTMDETDRRAYRALLLQNDDVNERTENPERLTQGR